MMLPADLQRPQRPERHDDGNDFQEDARAVVESLWPELLRRKVG
jgi:hypothetical protein